MSSDTDASKRPTARPPWGSILVLLLCAVGLWGVRSEAAERFDRLTTKSDTYALPSPEQTVVLSLGYRAAVADLIYAHTLVSYGLHFQERRRFEHVGDYLETVNALDPTFAQPYLFADTLLTLQPEAPRPQDYVRAREVLERGIEALPYHQELWFVAGQFIGYIAPPHLGDAEQARRWRVDGARLLARACELATDNVRIPRHCIVAASLLNDAGEREALIQMLSRTLAVQDDPEVRELALGALQQWTDQQRADDRRQRLQALDQLWQRDLPHVAKDQFLLLGPRLDVLRCVGHSPGMDELQGPCPLSLRAWGESLDARLW